MTHQRRDPRRYMAMAEHRGGPHRHGRAVGGLRAHRHGPRAQRGDVRAAILALLTEKPMHGYEMLKELEARTEGVWKPSAGSIYPTLQLREDEGLIEGTEAGGKRRFTLTDAGTEQAGKRESETSPWDEVSAGAGADRAKLGTALHQLNAAVGQLVVAATPEQRDRGRAVLDEARRSVYGILAETDPEADKPAGGEGN
ncbi:PadR family transcriptional regulator [soil metagenome]